MNRSWTSALLVTAACASSPQASLNETSDAECRDGLDNDGDGRTDCSDYGCLVQPVCTSEMDPPVPVGADAGMFPPAVPDGVEPREVPFVVRTQLPSEEPRPVETGNRCDQREHLADGFELPVGVRPAGWDAACDGNPRGETTEESARMGERGFSVSFAPNEAIRHELTWATDGTTRMAFWVKRETATGELIVSAANAGVELFQASPFAAAGAPYDANAWYRVEIELDFDHEGYRVLLDGGEVDAGGFSGAPLACGGASSFLSLGAGDQGFRAVVDEFMVSSIPSGCVTDRPYALGLAGTESIELGAMTLPEPSQSFTIEAWVRAAAWTSTTGGGTFFTQRTECEDVRLGFSEGEGAFFVDTVARSACGETGRILADAGSAVDRWHHVAAVYSDGTLRLFVDGALVGEQQRESLTRWSESVIGRWVGGAPGTASGFEGLIDELRVSPVARYEGASLRVPAELVADTSTAGAWRFDEGFGTATIDDSTGRMQDVGDARWLVVTR